MVMRKYKEDTNRLNAIKQLLEKHIEIKTGIIGSKATETKRQETGKLGLKTVVEIASYHEFGRGVPERSFIRRWFDENVNKLGKFAASVLRKNAEEGSGAQALNQIGLYMQSGVQGLIESGALPALKYREGIPLKNTGQLVSSITYIVEEK